MAPSLTPFVVPLTCMILVGLFAIQKRGTGSVGAFFGPVVALWFATLRGARVAANRRQSGGAVRAEPGPPASRSSPRTRSPPSLRSAPSCSR